MLSAVTLRRVFTGIIEELGTVRAANWPILEIAASTVLHDITVGASIAVDGCCLTAIGHGEEWWRTELSDETLTRTTLGDLSVGDRVNLERPLALGSRLSGHVVQGHVDGIGEVVRSAPDLAVLIPPRLAKYVVEKGSIALDGVSLTAFDIGDAVHGSTVHVAVIAHTSTITTLGYREPGDHVNVEVDILAKHVERLASIDR